MGVALPRRPWSSESTLNAVVAAARYSFASRSNLGVRMRRTLFVFMFGLLAGIAAVLVLNGPFDLGPFGDSASEVLDDAGRGARHLQLETRVRTALALQKDFDLFGGIAVAAEGDVVTLAGTVGSAAQRQLAELIANGVDGVGGIVNELEISADER